MIGIGDIDGKSRDRRKVITREGQLFYKGKKYAIEKATGYYVCTVTDDKGRRRRLHDVMWETEHGKVIPEGYVIHHKDWNKNNNVIENLELVTVREHNLIHNPPTDINSLSPEDREIYNNLVKRNLIIF